MPAAPTPMQDLADNLKIACPQRVDITALIKDVARERIGQTKFGTRLIVDVTIVDGFRSDAGVAEASFSVFFCYGARGEQNLRDLQECHQRGNPVSLFGLSCHPRAGGKVELKMGQDFFWERAGVGPKTSRLSFAATELKSLSKDDNQVAQELAPTQQARDYLIAPCTLTSAALLNAIVEQANGDYAFDRVFQLSHVHVVLLGSRANVFTADRSSVAFRCVSWT